jgi:xyloglucan-specific endo-beta-1,4-glucanase
MIWLANYNSGPISYNYNAQGHPVAIESNINIAGHPWCVSTLFFHLLPPSLSSAYRGHLFLRNLYYGNNGYNYVYSFLPASGTISSFSGDVNAFLKHLTGEGKIPSNHFLTTFEAGTEATSGSGVTFTTSAYSATIA